MPIISLSDSPLESVRSPTKKLKILRIFNILTILLVFSSSVYFAIFSRPSSGDIIDKHPTYFTPSIIFVKIFWLILYFLQFGFAFYVQFQDTRIVQDIVENVVNCLFSLSNLFMCGWLYFWVTENFVVSGIFAFLTLITTSVAQYRLRVRYTPNHQLIPVNVIAFICVPFSMFSGYSWLALINNGSIVFEFNKVEHALILDWVIAIIGFTWCFIGARKRDFTFSTTIAWLLLGIGFHQSESSIIITCCMLALLQIISIIMITIKYRLRSNRSTNDTDSESRNLLQPQVSSYGGVNTDVTAVNVG